MALALVLSVQLSMEPDSEALEVLCQHLHDHVKWGGPFLEPKSTSLLVATTLQFVVISPSNALSTPWPVE